MILQLDTNGNLIREWGTAREAATALGSPSQATNITACLNGRRKMFKGFLWKRSETAETVATDTASTEKTPVKEAPVVDTTIVPVYESLPEETPVSSEESSSAVGEEETAIIESVVVPPSVSEQEPVLPDKTESAVSENQFPEDIEEETQPDLLPGEVWEDIWEIESKKRVLSPDGEPLKEVWSLEGMFQVSNMGRIRSKKGIDSYGYVKNGRYYKPYVAKRAKRLCVTIYYRERNYNFPVATLVAKYFVPNPKGYSFLEFKDGNIRNCQADNLVWVAYTKKQQQAALEKGSKVAQYSLDGTLLRIWECAAIAMKSLGIGTILLALDGRHQDTAGGYIWRTVKNGPPQEKIPGFTITKGRNKNRKVVQLTKEGEVVNVWDKISSIKKGMKLKSVSSISECCSGKRKSAYGYIWRYAESEGTE